MVLKIAVVASLIFIASAARAQEEEAVASKPEPSEVESINAAIQQAGAQWTAGPTSMNRLAPAERVKRLGRIRNRRAHSPDEAVVLDDRGEVTTRPHTQRFAVPRSRDKLDYRDWYGKNYVTPIKDQGQCGSCVAFAETSAFETYLMLRGLADEPILAPQTILSCGADTCDGGYPDQVAEFIMGYGLPEESSFPYVDYAEPFATPACPFRGRRNPNGSGPPRLAGYTGVGKSVAALKAALVSYGPIPVIFNVYSDFYSYVGGVYSHVSGVAEGSHDVLIVGYDDAIQAFIVKNSWGTWWGEQGYFKIAYSELYTRTNFGAEALAYEPALGTNAKFVAVAPPPQNIGPGRLATASVTMKNVGGTVWTAAEGYKLGAEPEDAAYWGRSRVELSGPDRVEPGQTHVFHFKVIAPKEAGVYPFAWRMVQENVSWFGDLTPLNLTQVGVGGPPQPVPPLPPDTPLPPVVAIPRPAPASAPVAASAPPQPKFLPAPSQVVDCHDGCPLTQ
ncbi:MAG: C1 family peptidase [Elusimicrobiota bacterium]